MTFVELAEKIVRAENRPLTPEEIWQIACTKQYDAAVGSQGKTPWTSIGAQLYVSVKTDPKSQWMRVGKRPTRFYLKDLNTAGQYSATTAVTIQPASPAVSVAERYFEKDLHCLLAYFAFHNLRAYCKTIIHSKSRKTNLVNGCIPTWSVFIIRLMIGKMSLSNSTELLVAFQCVYFLLNSNAV